MIGTCEEHGALLPCLPDVTVPGTKQSAKYTAPSYIEIKESTIPGAGDGAFTTQFIDPGRILGNLVCLFVALLAVTNFIYDFTLVEYYELYITSLN